MVTIASLKYERKMNTVTKEIGQKDLSSQDKLLKKTVGYIEEKLRGIKTEGRK